MRDLTQETYEKYRDISVCSPQMFVTATWTDLLALAEGDRLEELLEEGLIPNLPPEAWQGIVEDLKPHYELALWKVSP